MPTRKSVQRIWRKMGSGLVVPAGTVSHVSESSSQTYLHIKQKAVALEGLYAQSEVHLPPTCHLARLIVDAKSLSDSWLMNKVQGLPTSLLFRVHFLDRLVDALLPLQNTSNRTEYLRALTSGSLDLLSRDKSKAKDVLWELELWSNLQRRSFDAVLSDPPDIVVVFEDSKIGISCKKIYSEKHVQNVLSEAVAQIETSFSFGVVAINLDDLVPPNHLLRAPTQQTIRGLINDFNTRFLHEHERHFRKYLASGRLLSALVSTNVLADVYRARPRFNNACQWTIWAIPGLPLEKDRQLKRFYNQLIQ